MSKTLALTFMFVLLYVRSFAAVNVTAESDKSSVHVGDRLLVTVRAARPDSPSEPVPSHAALQLGPEWEAGAQTAESERVDLAGRVKTWHFELHARSETTSTITPVVILGGSPPEGPPLATNRVLGPSLSVTILPPKVRPWWLPHPKTIAFVFGLATLAFTVVRALRRRRQNAPRPALTPLEEAIAMMEEVHANCREDRASRFFVDVERVLSGYLSRRTGRPLGSATASEMATLVSQYVPDTETRADLETILQRCTTARFSGARTEYRSLSEIEELTLRTLERLDAAWVTDTSPEATLGRRDRT
jgi:hypothetical protein